MIADKKLEAKSTRTCIMLLFLFSFFPASACGNLTTRTEVSTFWIQGPYHMGGGAPGHGARNHIYMHRSDAEGPKLNHNIYILV